MTLHFVMALSLVFVGLTCGTFAAENPDSPARVLDRMLEKKDYLGARVFVRRIDAKKLTAAEWFRIHEQVLGVPQLGEDLALRFERNRPLLPASQAEEVSDILRRADQQMLQNDFQSAFEGFQKAAHMIRSFHSSSEHAVYPSALHGMARALYALRRYPEALEVYSWIPSSYPRYRHVLFETMWTGFKQGKIDIALGAIASQKSAYFSKYTEPETYLIQVYLYKALCREEDLKQVMAEINEFSDHLKSGAYNWPKWARSEIDTRALLGLAIEKELPEGGGVSRADRLAEQQAIRSLLKRHYDYHRKRLMDDLKVVLAYSNLAVTPGMVSLKPVEKLPSRAELFRSNLEIWPADSAEDWVDEVGHHRFIGESLCVGSR